MKRSLALLAFVVALSAPAAAFPVRRGSPDPPAKCDRRSLRLRGTSGRGGARSETGPNSCCACFSSRSDAMTVAVGFNPQTGKPELPFVA